MLQHFRLNYLQTFTENNKRSFRYFYFFSVTKSLWKLLLLAQTGNCPKMKKMSFDLCAVCKRIKHSALLYCCLPVLRNGQRLVTQRGISLASQWKMMESSGK